jgi:hypothetical protein
MVSHQGRSVLDGACHKGLAAGDLQAASGLDFDMSGERMVS